MVATDQTAPGRLELLRGFVNTADVETATEELGDAESAAAWLRSRQLLSADSILEADVDRLRGLREALRALLLSNNTGDPPPASALEVLNEQSAQAAIGLRFDSEGAELVTRCAGVDSAIARLLAIAHESMSDGTWARLKVCPADDCRWAFYDHSRNRSGTWCVMEVCGNRAKARSYRERHRAQASR